MDRSLRASIEALIRAKRSFDFEAFINQLYLTQFSSGGYSPTRERRDEGADGLIIKPKTIIASYGPDSYDERRSTKKISEDFDAYLSNWAKDNPNWKMHYNGSLAPEQIRICNGLVDVAKKKGLIINSVHIVGVEQIMNVIESELSNIQIRQIANYLGVAKELIIFDHLRAIIDDLIRGIDINFENVEYKLEVDVQEKISLNYSTEDIISAKEEYTELVIDGTLKKIWGIISTYENEQINSLKLRIKREFSSQAGSFRHKIDTLTASYLNKYSSGQDDDIEYFTRALLVYCFEQCMIGEKTNKEKESKVL